MPKETSKKNAKRIDEKEYFPSKRTKKKQNQEKNIINDHDSVPATLLYPPSTSIQYVLSDLKNNHDSIPPTLLYRPSTSDSSVPPPNLMYPPFENRFIEQPM